MKLGAFIMTYKRPVVAGETIKMLFQQSRPPDKVWIIDNDPNGSASILKDELNLPLEYVPVGFNSGPAGAAMMGLSLLSKEGYDWILWIDDDDPPIFPDVLERLLKLAGQNKFCGCVGIVGQYFDRKTSLIKRVPDKDIFGEGCLEVDTISGNMIKMINGKMIIKHSIFPEKKLFFGFEELDMDLKIQQQGYKLFVDKELYLRHRRYYKHVGMQVHRGKQKNERELWRDYYSTRNMLLILRFNHLYSGILFTLLRSFLKMFSGFRYGVVYGLKNAHTLLIAIWHAFINKYGKTI